MKPILKSALTLLGLTLLATTASAQLFDEDVTPDVIFGSGNANGAFTVSRGNGVELGLRAKVRFDSSNQPQNIFNSNGDGSYTFVAGLPPTGFGFAPGSTSTATWNFEWSINTDYFGSTGLELSDLVYELAIDFDPSGGTNYLVFDPINLPLADHAIGTNATGNGGGVSAATAADYASLIASNNVAQNSWNMEFFDDGLLYPFSGEATGVYSFYLSATDLDGNLLARTDIDVHVVPEPATNALIALAGLVGFIVWRRRRS